MLLALTFLPSTSLTDGWIPNAPDDSHRVVTATSFLANTACPSRQQNWDNCRGMDSDMNWGSRLKTQLCLLAGTPGNSVFILPCSRAPSNNRQRNTKEEKDMPQVPPKWWPSVLFEPPCGWWRLNWRLPGRLTTTLLGSLLTITKGLLS